MLPFTAYGSGDTTLILMPFLAGTQSEWTEVVELLAPLFRCVTVDLPGFGAAAQTPGYTVDAMADALIAVIAGLASGRYVLVGHSMAGKVSAVAARRLLEGASPVPAPSALILVAPSPPGPEPMDDAKREQMLALFGPTSLTFRDLRDLRKDAARYLDDNLAESIPDAIFERTVEGIVQMNHVAWEAWLTGGSKEDWTEYVGVVPLPTLIVAGSQDAALGPETQRRVTLPHFSAGSFAALECSHVIPLERPAELAALITNFLRSADLVTAGPFADEARLAPDYLALIHSTRVSPQTREALLTRGQPDYPAYEPQTFTREELATLRALLLRVIPQPDAEFQIDLAARIDKQLANSPGDGWRYATLPADAEAWRRGLALLHEFAQKLNAGRFDGLAPEAQDALLEAIASGRVISPKLDLRRWFEDLRADAVRLYVAHPQTLARMGYSGIADDLSGFVQIGIGEVEPWEPRQR